MNQPPLESYALLADRATAALVSREGSIDWLCLPRFDSPAVFAALLGDPSNGRWLMHPVGGEVEERRYLPNTFVLETTWRTPTGRCLITEFMPQQVTDLRGHSDLVRIVRCLEGEVTVRHDLRMRFRYGLDKPWVRRSGEDDQEHLIAISGPEALCLYGPMLHPEGGQHCGDFTVTADEELAWTLVRFRSYDATPPPTDVRHLWEKTIDDWRRWADDIIGGDVDEHVRRSLLVLRALTHHETGGVLAAATTSLPEEFGGSRNWDYRFVWLRDSALTIEAMVAYGLTDDTWRQWLLRAIADDVEHLRIMYGLGGERVDEETELDHLAGYHDSRPVRIGNGAKDQHQADVVGEVMIALRRLRETGVAEDTFSWSLQRHLLDFAEAHLGERDQGIWEMRGSPQWFTHGRVMLWAAFDCGIAAVEEYGLDGEVDRWREIRDQLGREIDERAFNPEVNSFTQTYDNTEVDASLLVLPHSGYCAWDDPRMLSTVARIEAELMDEGGMVHRYRTENGADGLAGSEYSFLICSFWLVNYYAKVGRVREARELYDRVAATGGALDLLAEEYDTESGRLAGNYPQAFSHLGLVQAAEALREAEAALAGDSGTPENHLPEG